MVPKSIDYLHHYKKEGLHPILKPLYRVVYSNCSTTRSTSCSTALLCTLLQKMQSFFQNIGKVGLRPIGPQHPHVTRLESLSYFSFDFFHDDVVGIFELLQSLYDFLFFVVHFLQQCFYQRFCSLLYHHYIPLLNLLKLLIHFLAELESLILPWMSSLCQKLFFLPYLLNLFSGWNFPH